MPVLWTEQIGAYIVKPTAFAPPVTLLPPLISCYGIRPTSVLLTGYGASILVC